MKTPMKTSLNQLDQPPPKPPATLSGHGLTLWRAVQSEFAIIAAGGFSILTIVSLSFGASRGGRRAGRAAATAQGHACAFVG
jgi:hypothetical protein